MFQSSLTGRLLPVLVLLHTQCICPWVSQSGSAPALICRHAHILSPGHPDAVARQACFGEPVHTSGAPENAQLL